MFFNNDAENCARPYELATPTSASSGTRSAAMLVKLCSGDDVGPHSSVNAVGIKILAVYGEKVPDSFALSNPNQRRSSKIHWTVGVLAHQLPYSRNVSDVEWQEPQDSSC
jgi:hypothetical protein